MRMLRRRTVAIIGYAFLLQVYLRYVKELDWIIETQAKQGNEPVIVPFAVQLLDELRLKGFSEKLSSHYLSLFYQMRRAFFFIDRSLVGQSASMKQLRESLWGNVFTSDIGLYDQEFCGSYGRISPPSILGETGTGKGSAASAIGRSAYIPFNSQEKNICSELSMRLSSQSIFPNFLKASLNPNCLVIARGRSQGRWKTIRVYLKSASVHGALFLDEIGEVSIPIQIKLLQILQERTFNPVGSHE